MTFEVNLSDPIRTIDFLTEKYVWIAYAALAALFLFAISLLAAIGLQIYPDTHILRRTATMALWGVLLISLILMVSSTFVVVKNRARLIDWGLFLIVVWAIPYIGVVSYIGFSALKNLGKTRVRAQFDGS